MLPDDLINNNSAYNMQTPEIPAAQVEDDEDLFVLDQLKQSVVEECNVGFHEGHEGAGETCENYVLSAHPESISQHDAVNV